MSDVKITVGMLKGGTSRTTTAVYLALAEHRRHGARVLLVDADPANGTAYEWVEDAQRNGWPKEVEMAYLPVSSLPTKVPEIMDDRRIENVVIDTGNSDATIRNALRVTDHLVIPIAPSLSESTRFRPTLEVATQVAMERHIEVSILLTRVVHGTLSRAGMKAMLESQYGTIGLNILNAEIPRLERFATAYGKVPADLSPYTAALDELHTIEERN